MAPPPCPTSPSTTLPYPVSPLITLEESETKSTMQASAQAQPGYPPVTETADLLGLGNTSSDNLVMSTVGPAKQANPTLNESDPWAIEAQSQPREPSPSPANPSTDAASENPNLGRRGSIDSLKTPGSPKSMGHSRAKSHDYRGRAPPPIPQRTHSIPANGRKAGFKGMAETRPKIAATPEEEAEEAARNRTNSTTEMSSL